MARAEASRGRYLSDAKKLYVREVLLRHQVFAFQRIFFDPPKIHMHIKGNPVPLELSAFALTPKSKLYICRLLGG